MRWFPEDSNGHGDVEDMKIHSSLDQLNNFLNSAVYLDLVESIQAHIEERKEALKTAKELDDIRVLQGEISAFEQVINLPLILRDLKEELSKNQEGDSNE